MNLKRFSFEAGAGGLLHAVINDPNTAANVMRVGMGGTPGWMPGHVTPGPLPVGAGGAYRLGMQSGTMAAALGANAEIYQFRYAPAGSRVALVHGISISAAVLTLPAISTTVLTGPFQIVGTIARAWTAAGSGGTRAVLTTNNSKLRTTHATSEVNDAGIASTAALTAGTKTLDGSNFGSVTGNAGGVLTAVGVASSAQFIPKCNLMGEFLGGLAFPLILANQEGFVLRNGATAFPATLTWTFTVEVIWSEVDGF
jgi:hypothetical protein